MLFRRAELPHLAELLPSHWDDEPVLRSRAMLSGLAGAGPLALELVARAGEQRFYLRTWSGDTMDAALNQARTAYPQAGVRYLDLDERPYLDHLRPGPGEVCRGVLLRLARPSVYPLDTDTRHGDPLKNVLAASSGVGAAERLVVQLTLSPAPPPWSERQRSKAEAQASARRYGSRQESSASLVPVIGLLGLAGVASQAYEWYQRGDTLLLAAAGAGALVALPMVAVLASKVLGGKEEIAAELVKEKLAYPVFEARLSVIAFGPMEGSVRRLSALATSAASAFGGYEHPMGNALQARRKLSASERFSPHAQDVLNAAEAAALWHLPDKAAGLALHPGTSAHRLLPAPDEVGRGCRVGISTHQGIDTPVYMPHSLLGRNQLIVAKTRRGKSTLLVHQASYLMHRMVRAKEKLLLVVVDPHQDLAEAVLGQVPDGMEDRVTYLNLADRERPIGLNLLDIDLFPDRDRTAENVITMMHRLWPDNWGPRMEQALRSCLLCLHQASRNPDTDERFTLLDVLPMLSHEHFRAHVKSQVADRALWVSLRDNYESLNRVLQQQIANPVSTKIGRFLVSESTRFIVGQPYSTWDPRSLLRDGGVLVVNSAVGVLGEGPAALLGATILNLLAALVEQQVNLPPSQRTRVVALVDESTTMGAADYPRMLSELGKYGASFVLVTQSLSKLDAIDDALRPTIFANIDGLTAFQCSAQDGRYLTAELGGDIDIPDLVSLDDYECYARWSADGHKLPAFSLRLDPPHSPNVAKATLIARRSAQRFGRPRDEVAEEITEILQRREPPKPQPAEKKPTPAATDSNSGSQDTNAGDANPSVAKHVRNHHRNQGAQGGKPQSAE